MGERVCAQCGKPVVPPKRCFCSAKCRVAFYREARCKGRPERLCAWCGRPIPSSRSRQARYCSDGHMRAAQRQFARDRKGPGERGAGRLVRHRLQHLNGEPPPQVVRLLLRDMAMARVSFEVAWPLAMKATIGRVDERDRWKTALERTAPTWQRIYETQKRSVLAF